MSISTETITISTDRYKRLLETERILNALYAGGVDNWEWYDEAMDSVEFDDDEEDEDAQGD